MEKTELIDGIAEIVKKGSSCVGNMSWETPYIVFRIHCESCRLPYGDYKWQSENIPQICLKMDNIKDGHLNIGTFFDIECRVRKNRVWRINKLRYR